MKTPSILATLGLLFLTGCNLLPDNLTFVSKRHWEQEKTALIKEYDEKTKKTVTEIETKVKEKETAQAANLQKASGLAYGILQISELKPAEQRTRPDTLLNFKSKELVTRLPNLTTEELLRVNEELKKELDDKNTTLQDLQKKYDVALQQAKADKETIEKIQNEIITKKKELDNINADKATALLALADAKAEKDSIEKAKLEERLKHEQEKAELIKYLIKIFVGIGVGAAIGAYATRSLVLALASMGAFGLSIFIATLPMWAIITAAVVIGLFIIAGILYKLYLTHKSELVEKELADRLVGSIEETKNKIGSDKFKAELGPVIEDWIKDMPELKGKIKEKLKNLNLA